MATTPAILPGESHGQRSLAGYSPWGHKEPDTTEYTMQTCMYKLQFVVLDFGKKTGKKNDQRINLHKVAEKSNYQEPALRCFKFANEIFIVTFLMLDSNTQMYFLFLSPFFRRISFYVLPYIQKKHLSGISRVPKATARARNQLMFRGGCHVLAPPAPSYSGCCRLS